MEYRVFQYGVDDCYINDILAGIEVVCNGDVGAEEWFYQRFEQNPLGRAILICAFESSRLVACMAVERVPFENEGQAHVGGYISNSFIHEDYRSPEIMSMLLKLAETESKHEGLDVLYAFDKSNIATDISKMGWIFEEIQMRYRLYPIGGVLRSLFKLIDMSKPFVPELQNDKSSFVNPVVEDVLIENLEMSYWTWRSGISEKKCVVINNDRVFAIAGVGHRGKRVREAHICYMVSKGKNRNIQQCRAEVVQKISEKIDVNVVSCADELSYVPKDNSLVRTQFLNCCYKWLGNPESSEMTKFGNILCQIGCIS